MDLLRQFMERYRLLFHPFVVLVATTVGLTYHEWRADGTGWPDLARRLGTVGVAVVVGTIPIGGFLLFTGRRSITPANVWYVDLLATAGLVLASAVAWMTWSRRAWGRKQIGFLKAVATAAVPFATVSLVWNVSGHVTFTTVPTLYLVLLDSRLWPLVAIPIVMVVNRPFLGVHTWSQALGGLVLGTAAVVVGDALHDRRIADLLGTVTPAG